MNRNSMRHVNALLLSAFLLAGCGGPGPLTVLPRPTYRADPVIMPGDALRLTVWQQPAFSGEFQVAGDSSLAHPILQRVKVGGVPLSVGKARLRDVLITYTPDPQFVVEPLFPIFIGGEVGQPNVYRLPNGTTLSQAVATAGGLTERSNLEDIRFIRNSVNSKIDLRNPSVGSGYGEIPLQSGDQVIVGRTSGFNVFTSVINPLSSLATFGLLIYLIVTGERLGR